MAKVVFMRGLQNFISDIRAATSKEEEQKRVEKELAKIREKFGDDKALTGYDRRKYVWKLLYIYMLGYEINFGHKQACDLIPLPKYKDKQVGYMACSLLLTENDDFLRLSINGIHNDLTSRNETYETIALSFVGNVSGQEMAEALTPDVLKLLASGAARPVVKKRASLCLLRFIRKTPAEQQVVTADTFSSIMNSLLEERDLGLLLSSVTLLYGILAKFGPAGYETSAGRVLKILQRLVMEKDREVAAEYLYYNIPSPWLQARCLRTLQFFPPPEAPADRAVITGLLQTMIENMGAAVGAGTISSTTGIEKSLNANKANALYGILFEAISLALHLDTDRKLLANSVAMLGKFLSTREPNVRYLALETLGRLALVPEILEAIRMHQATVVAALKDPDVSIRKRAMDLLFTMCDQTVADEVVSELVKYLQIADFSMREELVLKIAILAEKFAPSVQWYVDVALQLLERAGDFVSDDIWHRVVQLVTNNDSMQQYAARNTVEVLKRGATHESLVCTAAYLLGEFGRLITAEVPPAEQFKLLHALFPAATQQTKGLLMTAFIKIYLLDPQNQNLRREVTGLFERFSKFMDADLQQRAAEYLALSQTPQPAAQQYLLPMPKWPERESTLLKRLQRGEGGEDGGEGSTPTALQGAPGMGMTMDGTSPSSGTRLIVGGPLTTADSAGLPANGDPLLGATSSSAPVPQQPPKPSNPIDLLSDLLGDAVTVTPPPAAAPAAAAAPGLPGFGSGPFGMAGPGPAAGPAVPGFGAPAPVVGSNPFGAPVPVPSSNPFAAPAAIIPPPGQPPMPGPIPVAPAALAVPQPVAAANLAAAAAPAAATAAFAVPGGGGFDDPFGDNAFGAAPARVYEAARPLGDVLAWYAALLTKERGILYEDQYLQVGVQSRYTQGRGEVVLFLGNKNGEQALSGLALDVTGTAGVTATAGAAPGSLAPKQQVQVPVQLVSLTPSVEPPSLRLRYKLANVVVDQPLSLPVAPHKFVVPDQQIAKELFFSQWKAGSGPPHKSQEMVERTTPLTSDAVVGALRLFNLGVEHGYLDPSPFNEAGAGYFWTAAAPGQEQQTLVMCRVEGNPQTMSQFRVTVVSTQPALSSALKDAIVAQVRMIP